ncbi:MAG: hypothetical protein JO223_25865 [Hyphomicrobiales bacterium]|nr:hypothetical protein [Hyphomicrobiales bacterium]MBV8441043.1 hypothetical protein [Hyphomicrobiales bacterium]
MTSSSFGGDGDRDRTAAFRLRMQEPGYPPPADVAPDPYSTRAKTLGVRAHLSGAAPKDEALDGGDAVELRGTVFANSTPRGVARRAVIVF